VVGRAELLGYAGRVLTVMNTLGATLADRQRDLDRTRPSGGIEAGGRSTRA
jgi:hypothetical protein